MIAEMGGKTPSLWMPMRTWTRRSYRVVHLAFSYQGQKCWPAPRLIVLEAIYEKLVCRIGEATAGFLFGSPEDPKNFLGAVIEPDARKKILEYIEIGKQEGELLVEEEALPQGGGYGRRDRRLFRSPCYFHGSSRPEHRLQQDEIFGPVLSVITVKDIAEAIEVANSTPYALTGGIFSRSPENIARVGGIPCGNLYINRGITGAVVGRHPFGGFRMSGVGSKSGSPEYLLQFMVQRNVVENTMRRGFAPAVERDRPSD